jgi:cyclohexadieny/prephenate dehydrogenase
MTYYDRITVIGAGLVGSSLLRVIAENRLSKETCLYDNDANVRARASSLGLADKIAKTAVDAVKDADLVVMAVPVGAMAAVAEDISPGLAEGAVVTDTGSTKTSVIRDVSPILPENCHFIPSHPIAGTEYSGPEAGFSTLFKDHYWVVLPGKSPDEIVDHFKKFLMATGAMVEEMDVDYHDKVLAITSHLPHLIAYTIVGTAFDFEQQVQNDVIRYSAAGFRDFTRIAASDPVMWRDVFLNNGDAVLEMLGRFNEDLSYLQRAIRWKEGDKLEELFSRTKAIRTRIRDIGQLD